MTKTSCAGIAVQFLLALDHESGCTNLLEGTGAVSGLPNSYQVRFTAGYLFAKTVTKK
jgi:hypothetical protein